MLDHEKLDVHRCALEFAQLCFEIGRRLPRGYGELGDQLKRAAGSIALNIAEGTGKPALPDRRRFYAIARGSVMEAGACLDILRLAQVITPEQCAEAKGLAVRLAAMLSKMCR